MAKGWGEIVSEDGWGRFLRQLISTSKRRSSLQWYGSGAR
jgi:hypothetical protein